MIGYLFSNYSFFGFALTLDRLDFLLELCRVGQVEVLDGLEALIELVDEGDAGWDVHVSNLYMTPNLPFSEILSRNFTILRMELP